MTSASTELAVEGQEKEMSDGLPEVERPEVLAACVMKAPGHDGDLERIASTAWDLYELVLAEPQRRRKARAQQVAAEGMRTVRERTQRELARHLASEALHPQRLVSFPETWNEREKQALCFMVAARRHGIMSAAAHDLLAIMWGTTDQRARAIVHKVLRKAAWWRSHRQRDLEAEVTEVVVTSASPVEAADE